jgi:dipeptidyl aminopeptidase/acylaminoacyl peptidase
MLVAGSIGFLICTFQLQAQHPFSVRDSIELTTFNEPSEQEHDAKTIFSPDGKHLLIVTSRGLIRSNQIESILWVYDTAAVRLFVNQHGGPERIKPRRILSVVGIPEAFDSDAYGALITDPRWASDSRHVYFLRQIAGGYEELCEVDTHNTAVRRLTPRGYDVQQFAAAGNTIAATISRSPIKGYSGVDAAGDVINEDARAVTGLPLVKILFPDRGDRRHEIRDVRLWIAKQGATGRILLGESSQRDTGVIDMLSISPKGKLIARLLPVTSVPDSWADYEPLPILPGLRIIPNDTEYVSPRNIMRLKSYAVLDPQTGKERFRVNAPNSRPLGFGILDKAVWSADESRLLLTNTFLPLKGATQEERAQRLRSCVVADVELPSQEVRCVSFSHYLTSGSHDLARPPWLGDASFGKDKDEVVLRYRGSSGKNLERYQLHGDHWVLEDPAGVDTDSPDQVSLKGTPANGIQITLRQDLNSSPVLWATDTWNHHAKPLWDPNPQLAGMKLGEASVYRWKDADGVEWTGGLIKPVDYTPGERYPLVIQTHGFSGGMFKEVTDGAFPTAMAARPLTSAGIMVLQVPDDRGREFTTSAEAQRHVEGFRSAIAQLTSEGLIDPKRVGVIGFSRTCWYVESALIEYPDLFSAATIADGVDESYVQYRLFAQEAASWGEEFEKINQAKPIGEGLQQWFTHAPDFHLDRVKTPLRIEALGPRSILLEWEIYSSLQQQGKPVDLIYIPDGQHVLQKPLERLASQQGNVDWFRFWLGGSHGKDLNELAHYHRCEYLKPQHCL